MRHKLFAIALGLGLGVAGPLAAQPRTVYLTPSIALRVDRDPIDDTDYSSVVFYSTGGIAARLQVSCAGEYTSAFVGFNDRVPTRLLVVRFGTERPDSFPQDEPLPMRQWGDGTVRLLVHAPSAVADIPDTRIPGLVRGLRAGGRVVVRRQGTGTLGDSWFDATGAARGLDRLSCLRSPPPVPPRVLGRQAGGYDDFDVEPVPADSAATANGLEALRPALDDGVLPYMVGSVYVNAAGAVDSVQVYGTEPRGEARIRDWARALPFRPAQRNGQPVAGIFTFQLYKAEEMPQF